MKKTGGVGGNMAKIRDEWADMMVWWRIICESVKNRFTSDSKPLFGQNTDKKFRSLSHAFLLHPQNQSVHIHLRVVKTV